MSNLKKNLGYQTIYQILNVGLPLITAPFLSRVLGADPLGVMSYTTSIVHFFTLFAMMGIVNYGTRSIAVVRDNIEERSNVFSQIFYMQLITSGVSFAAYEIYMIFLCKDNALISWIQGIATLACFFDINWFFFGIEEFKITVVRSMIIRVASVALMLFLVRGPSDLWIYALLLVGSTFISQIILWFYLPKYAKLKKQSFTDVKKHFRPNIKLFLPLLAMSVYHIMDKTMLGLLSNYTQSGYYYNADKVINIPVGILTGFVTVMLPRMSALVNENKTKEVEGLFNSSIRSISLISAPMCCGIAAISKEFTPFFFGNGYDDCVILIVVLAPVLFIKGFSFISRNLFLIPSHLENKLTASVIVGAVVNLIVNMLLIPKLGALGAVIGTLIAELVACLCQYKSVIPKVKCTKAIIIGITYFLIGAVMYVVVRLVADRLEMAMLPKLIIEVLVGAFMYGLMCLLYWIISKNRDELNLIKSFMKR